MTLVAFWQAHIGVKSVSYHSLVVTIWWFCFQGVSLIVWRTVWIRSIWWQPLSGPAWRLPLFTQNLTEPLTGERRFIVLHFDMCVYLKRFLQSWQSPCMITVISERVARWKQCTELSFQRCIPQSSIGLISEMTSGLWRTTEVLYYYVNGMMVISNILLFQHQVAVTSSSALFWLRHVSDPSLLRQLSPDIFPV